jgi:hypothetical protein
MRRGFLKVLERRGYEVHGVEVSGTILAHARDVLKLPNLFHGTLDAYPGRARFLRRGHAVGHRRAPRRSRRGSRPRP